MLKSLKVSKSRSSYGELVVVDEPLQSSVRGLLSSLYPLLVKPPIVVAVVVVDQLVPCLSLYRLRRLPRLSLWRLRCRPRWLRRLPPWLGRLPSLPLCRPRRRRRWPFLLCRRLCRGRPVLSLALDIEPLVALLLKAKIVGVPRRQRLSDD